MYPIYLTDKVFFSSWWQINSSTHLLIKIIIIIIMKKKNPKQNSPYILKNNSNHIALSPQDLFPVCYYIAITIVFFLKKLYF